jgi:hypothetical protein
MRASGANGSDYRQNSASVIIPAEEILKTAKQVPPPKNESQKAPAEVTKDQK